MQPRPSLIACALCRATSYAIRCIIRVFDDARSQTITKTTSFTYSAISFSLAEERYGTDASHADNRLDAEVLWRNTGATAGESVLVTLAPLGAMNPHVTRKVWPRTSNVPLFGSRLPIRRFHSL